MGTPIAGTGPGCPPAPPSATEVAAIATLDTDVQELLSEFRVAYSTQGALASAGWCTLQEVADRWTDKSDCRKSAAADLGFEEGTNGWVKNTTLLNSVRLAAAIDEARF